MRRNFRPFIIDVEASGFGPAGYPIEVGLALGRDEQYCSLIAPSDDWTHWDKNAEKIHHITQDILIRHGKPVKKVAKELNTLLEQVTVFSDGWVVDKPWITRLFTEARMVRTFFVSPLERILTEAQMEIWHETKAKVIGQLHLTRHRASTDAFIVQETYVKTACLTSSK